MLHLESPGGNDDPAIPAGGANTDLSCGHWPIQQKVKFSVLQSWRSPEWTTLVAGEFSNRIQAQYMQSEFA